MNASAGIKQVLLAGFMKNFASTNPLNNELPIEVRELLVRKLTHLKKEYEGRLLSENVKCFKRMTSLMDEDIREGRIHQAFVQNPSKVYNEKVGAITILTKSWPAKVWQSIIPVLEKANIARDCRPAVSTLIDEFSWTIESCFPFTLKFVNADVYIETVHREIQGYGIEVADTLSNRLLHSLSIHESAADCGITNVARAARVGIDIAVEEYFVGSLQRLDLNKSETLTHELNTPENSSRDLLIRPKKINDWYLAIEEMAREFYKLHRRLPNETEGWNALMKNPPVSFGIVSTKRNGENVLSMNGKGLKRRAFASRWRDYSPHKNIE